MAESKSQSKRMRSAQGDSASDEIKTERTGSFCDAQAAYVRAVSEISEDLQKRLETSQAAYFQKVEQVCRDGQKLAQESYRRLLSALQEAVGQEDAWERSYEAHREYALNMVKVFGEKGDLRAKAYFELVQEVRGTYLDEKIRNRADRANQEYAEAVRRQWFAAAGQGCAAAPPPSADS